MKDIKFEQKLQIRKYDTDDWKSICLVHDSSRLQELELTTDGEGYSSLENSYMDDELFAGTILVAEFRGRITGFIAYTSNEITWLYVDVRYQNIGVATKLLERALNQTLRPLKISVLSGNAPAISLYKKVGFCITATKKGTLCTSDYVQVTGHTMTLF